MRTLLTLISLSLSTILFAQQNHLDVEGHTKIRGSIDLNHMDDSTTVLIGRKAGINLTFTNDRYNTFLGSYSGFFNQGGQDNTFIGHQAGMGFTFGSPTGNTAVGESSGQFLTSGKDNTFVGNGSGHNTTSGLDNVFVGHRAGYENEEGVWNTGVGSEALQSNVDGQENTAVGYRALANNTGTTLPGHGNLNVAIGAYALENANTKGNTAVGGQTLRTLTSGEGNTGLGALVLRSILEGFDNTAVGNQAMYNAGQNVQSNVAFGSNAAQDSRGSFNSFLGASAGIGHKEGNDNILIGFAAASSDTTSDNQIVIGSNTTGVKDHSVVLGNSNITDIYMSSDSGAIIHASNAKIHDLQLVPDRDSVVVWLPDSTFAVREVSDLVEDINQVKIISLDQLISSTTYVDVSDMSFPLVEGTYEISGNLFVSSDRDVDMQWDYNGNMTLITWGMIDGEFSISTNEIVNHTLSNSKMNKMEGIIKVTNAGSLKLQMKRNVSEASNIVLQQNSYIILNKID